ncbi:hypothetical protein EJ06DRAFT_83831 [Trichodelitschia bisporula]|uniref:Uncharacterized protein n=1 Tax=Trichodelitschia bisporula TaxID=703511 RepID=A0A6G1HRM7_9PEZI|nr:hypothetical protein EJ06DRAFT_83831 [Trichodelitschia bisporula]
MSRSGRAKSTSVSHHVTSSFHNQSTMIHLERRAVRSLVHAAHRATLSLLANIQTTVLVVSHALSRVLDLRVPDASHKRHGAVHITPIALLSDIGRERTLPTVLDRQVLRRVGQNRILVEARRRIVTTTTTLEMSGRPRSIVEYLPPSTQRRSCKSPDHTGKPGDTHPCRETQTSRQYLKYRSQRVVHWSPVSVMLSSHDESGGQVLGNVVGMTAEGTYTARGDTTPSEPYGPQEPYDSNAPTCTT